LPLELTAQAIPVCTFEVIVGSHEQGWVGVRVCHRRRHTDTHRHTQTHRHTDTDTQTHRHTDTQTHGHTDTQTHRHTDDTQTRTKTQIHNDPKTQTHKSDTMPSGMMMSHNEQCPHEVPRGMPPLHRAFLQTITQRRTAPSVCGPPQECKHRLLRGARCG